MAKEKKEERAFGPEVEAHFERILDVIYALDLDGVTLLTGRNGSGKSLIRKQVGFRLDRQGYKQRSVSMDTRTGANTEYGALMRIGNDLGWLPTSMWSMDLFNKVTHHDPKEPTYLVLDELEVGMGEETQVAMAARVADWLATRHYNYKGVLIITHSRLVVERLKDVAAFASLDGYATADEWLGRELVPTDLQALDDNELFFYIRQRESEAKSSKK